MYFLFFNRGIKTFLRFSGIAGLYQLYRRILLLLPLALQPTASFGLLNNILPFFPIYHQLPPLLTPTT